MSSRLTKALVGAGAAVAALTVGMTSASAAVTYTVSAGSATAGTSVAINGKTTGALPRITFNDTTTNNALTCDSGTAPGTTKAGSGQAGAKIGKINGAGTGWTNCTGPFGLQFTVTGVGAWYINATGGNAAGVTGTISNILAHVTSTAGCNFDVTGSVPIKYTNSSQILQVLTTSAGLTLSNVTSSACFGLLNNGDKATFSAKYKLTARTAAYNPVQITRP